MKTGKFIYIFSGLLLLSLLQGLVVTPCHATLDLMIRAAGISNYTGDNIYNLDATNQSQSGGRSSSTDPVTFDICVQNDKSTSGSIRLHGAGSTDDMTVEYLYNGIDITSWVVDANEPGTWNMQPNESRVLQLRITPAFSTTGNTQLNVLVSGDSVGDNSDAVKGVTYVSERYQPDGRIAHGYYGGFYGENIFNLTGDDQAVADYASPGQTMRYRAVIRNSSNYNGATITVTGPAGNSGYSVSYYDATIPGSPVDVTSQVTSCWYPSGLSNVGDEVVMLIYVTPNSNAPIGSSFSVALTSTAYRYAMRDRDVIKATTFRQ